MNPSGAKTIVFISGGTLVALALIKSKSAADVSTYKAIWAAGLLTTGLSIFADFVPELVGPFAVLIIIAAVVASPGTLGNFIGGAAPTTAGTP